jgi:hypothetical protein
MTSPPIRLLPLIAAVLTGTLLAGLSSTGARAAHPVLTEDTGTQGKGRFELELGTEWAREGDARAFEFGPQLSWGALDNLDLIVRASWLDLRGTDASSRGIGDTALDVKWRFLEEGSFSLGLRAGVDLPTGNVDRDLGTGEVGYHGVLIASYDTEPFSFHANVGAIHVGNVPLQRRDLALGSVAVVWVVQEGLKLSAEVATASNPDPERNTWPAVARFGAICTLDKYWDVDIGYQTRLNHAAPETVILAGATLRW